MSLTSDRRVHFAPYEVDGDIDGNDGHIRFFHPARDQQPQAQPQPRRPSQYEAGDVVIDVRSSPSPPPDVMHMASFSRGSAQHHNKSPSAQGLDANVQEQHDQGRDKYSGRLQPSLPNSETRRTFVSMKSDQPKQQQEQQPAPNEHSRIRITPRFTAGMNELLEVSLRDQQQAARVWKEECSRAERRHDITRSLHEIIEHCKEDELVQPDSPQSEVLQSDSSIESESSSVQGSRRSSVESDSQGKGDLAAAQRRWSLKYDAHMPASRRSSTASLGTQTPPLTGARPSQFAFGPNLTLPPPAYTGSSYTTTPDSSAPSSPAHGASDSQSQSAALPFANVSDASSVLRVTPQRRMSLPVFAPPVPSSDVKLHDIIVDAPRVRRSSIPHLSGMHTAQGAVKAQLPASPQSTASVDSASSSSSSTSDAASPSSTALFSSQLSSSLSPSSTSTSPIAAKDDDKASTPAQRPPRRASTMAISSQSKLSGVSTSGSEAGPRFGRPRSISMSFMPGRGGNILTDSSSTKRFASSSPFVPVSSSSLPSFALAPDLITDDKPAREPLGPSSSSSRTETASSPPVAPYIISSSPSSPPSAAFAKTSLSSNIDVINAPATPPISSLPSSIPSPSSASFNTQKVDALQPIKLPENPRTPASTPAPSPPANSSSSLPGTKLGHVRSRSHHTLPSPASSSSSTGPLPPPPPSSSFLSAYRSGPGVPPLHPASSPVSASSMSMSMAMSSPVSSSSLYSPSSSKSSEDVVLEMDNLNLSGPLASPAASSTPQASPPPPPYSSSSVAEDARDTEPCSSIRCPFPVDPAVEQMMRLPPHTRSTINSPAMRMRRASLPTIMEEHMPFQSAPSFDPSRRFSSSDLGVKMPAFNYL